MRSQSIATYHTPKLDDICVIAKCHDTCAWYIAGQQFWPENSVLMGPGGIAITRKAMDKDDAVYKTLLVY